MARQGRARPRGLDAELARLLDDPDSIAFQPPPAARRTRPPRLRVPRGPTPARPRRARAVGWPSPVFLVLVALTAAGAVLAARGATTAGGVDAVRIGVFVFVLAGWLVSVCLHEFAHAFVAHRGGDDQVAARDYLRLNPFRYVHPLLSIVLPLVWIVYGGIGLPGGAVLIEHHRLRSRVWRSAVSAVGPLVNVVVAAVSLGALHLLQDRATSGNALGLYAALGWFAWLQIAVAVLNFVPVPGLDGFGIIEPWLPPDTVRSVAKIRPYGLLIVVALLWVPSISQAFSQLVERISVLLGDPAGLPYVGEQLFRFWH